MASTTTKKHIWLVGGGTGGHVVPLLAIAEVLQKDSSLHLTFIGEKNGKEKQMAKSAGLRFLSIPSGKLRRSFSLSSTILNVRDAIKLIAGVVKSYRLIKYEKPSLILTKGGPVSLPVAIAANITKTRLVTHESDAVIGKSNDYSAGVAETLFTGFPASYYPPKYASKIVHVGIPLRSAFCTSSKKKSSRPMILVTGGSQGSVSINQLIWTILPDLLKDYSVVHLVGETSYSDAKKVKELLPEGLQRYYEAFAFTPDIAQYMQEASVVITRGGSQIFEAASLGKPMIIIPLPWAAQNHQVKNAEIFARHKAAIMLIQDNLTPEKLYETIRSLLEDTVLQKELEEGTRIFNSCQAATKVAHALRDMVRAPTQR